MILLSIHITEDCYVGWLVDLLLYIHDKHVGIVSYPNNIVPEADYQYLAVHSLLESAEEDEGQ